MKTNEIPEFVSMVMTEILAGVDKFNSTARGLPKVRAKYPELIELQLSVYDAHDEYHQFWVKIPVAVEGRE